MSISKTQYRGVKDSNKQEKNINYQTYYLNYYNRDKNKRIGIADLKSWSENSGIIVLAVLVF